MEAIIPCCFILFTWSLYYLILIFTFLLKINSPTYSVYICFLVLKAIQIHQRNIFQFFSSIENKANEINNEWELNTRELLEESELLIFNLLTNSQYNFPAVLQDGTYIR